MIKRIAVGIVGLAILIFIILFALAWESNLDPQSPPPADAFSQEQVDRGRVLAGIGNCQSCHTINPDQPYAGGLAFATDFGTLYSTNITPDADAGIGEWSQEAFNRAMHEGVSRDGSHLFPAFPYTHFANVSNQDLEDLYAYIMTREAISTSPPDNTLYFPFNLRMLQAGWKLLFFDGPTLEKDANRGQYLAEGLGHCSACHTPRNLVGAEAQGKSYDGALTNNWYAPSLNTNHSAPVSWTKDELYLYLREGISVYHGVAAGSMAKVVHQGLAEASDDDIRALAGYFHRISDSGDEAQAASQAASAIRTAQANSASNLGRGEALFSYACASCHYNNPDSPNAMRPELSLNSAVTADDPTNLIRFTMAGISDEAGIQGTVMPGFANWSNGDLVSLFTFLRETHTDRPVWDDLESRIQAMRDSAGNGKE
ncbi:c-type cytochrome [Bermanella sp. R86510]|uniref:c-type cytochrome n=1 Tax=unclassified Bermanella TaxID=2627862 RepID=UPI0037C97FB8